MIRIQNRKIWENPQNFQICKTSGFSSHGFVHSKIKKSILNPKILEFVDDIGIIL